MFLFPVKYVNTQTTGEKFQLIVKLIQQALSELSPDKREHLQRATVLNNCDPNVDVKTSSTEFYELVFITQLITFYTGFEVLCLFVNTQQYVVCCGTAPAIYRKFTL